jgi:hypothetical protein
MRIPDHRAKTLAAAIALGLAAAASAQTVENPVLSGGVLVISSGAALTDNVLAAAPSTFSFSSALGGTPSANGFLYADYLVTVSASTAESVTTTLTNSGGVANLSERIYSYGGSFLGDAPVPGGALQAWSTNYPVPGATVSVISPTDLVAGQYVIELRGTNAGTFGGTLTLAPVPEPDGFGLAPFGLGALGFIARRRRDAA